MTDVIHMNEKSIHEEWLEVAEKIQGWDETASEFYDAYVEAMETVNEIKKKYAEARDEEKVAMGDEVMEKMRSDIGGIQVSLAIYSAELASLHIQIAAEAPRYIRLTNELTTIGDL